MFKAFAQLNFLFAFFDGYINPHKRNEPSFEEMFAIFIATLFVSFLVYALPVIIYRFVCRNGDPIRDKKKAVLVNFAFFACGIVAIIIFNALMGAYEDDTYHTTLGPVDAIFWGIDYLILTVGKNESDEKSSTPSDFETFVVEDSMSREPVPSEHVTNISSEKDSGGADETSFVYTPIRKATPPSEPKKDMTQLYDEYMDSLINPVLSLETGSICPVGSSTNDWTFELSVLLYVLADCALLKLPNREIESTRLWEHIESKYGNLAENYGHDFWSRVGIYADLLNGQNARCDWILSDPSAFQKANVPAKLIYAFGDFLINPGCRTDYLGAPIVLHGYDYIVDFSLKFHEIVFQILKTTSGFSKSFNKPISSTDTPPKNENQNSTEAKSTTYKGLYNSPSYRNLLHFHYGLSYEEIEQRAQQEARQKGESHEIKQPPAKTSSTQATTALVNKKGEIIHKQSEFLCDSMGNTEKSESHDNFHITKGDRTVPLAIMRIILLTITFSVIVFIVACIITLILSQPSNKTSSGSNIPNEHEYETDSSTDTTVGLSPYKVTYQGIRATMSSMKSPIEDLEFIEEKLSELPLEYESCKRISAQACNIKSYCDILERELYSEVPDQEAIQYAFDRLSDLKSNEIYGAWNIDNIILVYTDIQNSDSVIETDTSEETTTDGETVTIPVYKFIGDVKTKIYHIPSCSYLPDSENQIVLADDYTALSQGYWPCEYCALT